MATGVIKTVSHGRSVRSMQAEGEKQLLAGSLPRRQARLAEAWAELHQSDLAADWGRLQAGSEPLPIDPLP